MLPRLLLLLFLLLLQFSSICKESCCIFSCTSNGNATNFYGHSGASGKNRDIYIYRCVREIETWKAKLWPRGSGLIRPGQGSIYRAGQLYPIGSGRCRSLKKSIECPVLQLHLQLSPSLGIIGHGSAGFLLNQSSSTCSAALARSQRMWLQIYSSFCFQLF